MSLDLLCSIHTVDILIDTAVKGESMGLEYVQSVARSGVSCNVQELDAREIQKYGVRGMAVNFQVFFSSDPLVGTEHTIRHDGRYLRVKGAFKRELIQSSQVMWIVLCNEESSRQET